MDNIFLILINFNNYAMTIECVNSIVQSTYKNYSIVIVDNASSDDSYEKLSTFYNEQQMVYVIKASENNGFSAGNNIGIDFAIKHGAEYIMLLNNDTVIDKEMIALLHAKADKHTVTLPKMFYYSDPKVIWYAGGKIDYKCGNIKHIGQDRRDSAMYSSELLCSFMTGCCALIHKSVLQSVGLLDESYFMYGEDVDYSIRLKKKGIRILLVPMAKLWHKVGGSSSSNKLNIYYDTRNKLLLMDKYNFSKYAKVKYRLKIFLLYIRGIIKRNNDLYFKKAYIDYKKKVTGKVDLEK